MWPIHLLHASSDAELGRRVRSALAAEGHECAEEGAAPGGVAVLLLTARTGGDGGVLRELERLSSSGASLVPVLCEDVSPSAGIEERLGAFVTLFGWVDATGGSLAPVVHAVEGALLRVREEAPAPRRTALYAAAAAVVVAGALGAWLLKGGDGAPEAPEAAAPESPSSAAPPPKEAPPTAKAPAESPPEAATLGEAVAARTAAVSSRSGFGGKEEREKLARAGPSRPKAGTFSERLRKAQRVERSADEALEKRDYPSARKLFAEAEGLYREAMEQKAALDAAAERREGARRAREEADKAYRGEARPASFERGKQAFADGERALGEEDAAAAGELFGRAGVEFGRARAEAEALNALDDARTAWSAASAAADRGLLARHAAEGWSAAKARAEDGRGKEGGGDVEGATAAYRDATGALAAAVAEATTRENASRAEGVIARLEAAIRGEDKFEAEALLSEVGRLVPADPRVVTLGAKVSALPWPKRGEVDLGGGVRIAFARIEAGEFMMGSPEAEEGRCNDELWHKVSLTKACYIGVTEVTQAQWKAVMGTEPSNFKGANLPVEQASWEDAVAFCKKLSERAGAAYRLPTEAEWEYACRGGSADAHYGVPDDVAWHRGNSGGSTHPVATRKANAYGLHDMLGNVWEWCSDWYGEGYAWRGDGAVQDPTGPASGSARVMRGGAWYLVPVGCRAAQRLCFPPSGRDNGLGFRVARAEALNALDDARTAWSAASAAADQGLLARHAAEGWSAAKARAEDGRGKEGGGDVEGATAAYREATGALAAAVAEATTRENASRAEGVIARLEAAIRGNDKIEAEALLSEVGRLVPADPRGGALGAKVSALPWPKRYELDLGGGVRIAFARIEAGEFMMGSPEAEEGRDDDELCHKVSLTKACYIGVTEVTQAQWKAVMGTEPSYFKGADLPVEHVSWSDAVAFCKKLSERTGAAYRLPTEAEWEYACRGGSAEARYGVLDDVAWYWGNSGQSTHPVATRKANAYGLHDMLGNVWEWCSDRHRAYPAGDGAFQDPTGPALGSARVQRGGALNVGPASCRAAARFWGGPSQRSRSVGFRVARAS